MANLLCVITALPHSKRSGAISLCLLLWVWDIVAHFSNKVEISCLMTTCCLHTTAEVGTVERGSQETDFPKQASASVWNNCSSIVGLLLWIIRDWLWCEDESLHSAERDHMLRVVLICGIPPRSNHPSNLWVKPKALILLTAKAERLLKTVTERELHFRN